MTGVTTIDGNQIPQLAYPLLLGHVGRVALLQMTAFAAAAAWNLANARLRRRRRQRSMSMVVFAVSFAMVIPFSIRNWVRWAAPFWLVVPVAALGCWLLVREVAELESDGRV